MHCLKMKPSSILPIVIVMWGFLDNICSCSKSQDEAETVTTLVNRRLEYDIYEQSQQQDKEKHRWCDHQTTYLVEERQCVKNEDLFGSCRLSLTQNVTRRSIVNIDRLPDKEVIELDMHQKQINGSFCNIASLNVKRGIHKAFQINHTGFLLSINGTLKINKAALAYDLKQYEGELYLIKISCSQAQAQSEDNCLLFLVWGTSNVTEAKFNCTVPGTLYEHSNECPHKQTSTEPINITFIELTEIALLSSTATATLVTSSSRAVTDKSTKHHKTFEVGSPLYYGVIATGSGIIAVLVLCLCCICTILIMKRRRTKVSTITSLTLERRCSVHSKQAEEKNDKDLQLPIYELPDEVVKSHLYDCNCIESNPSYQDTGGLYTKKEKNIECDYSVIPEHLNPVYSYSNNTDEEPVYQEIKPRLDFKLDAKSSTSITDLHATITAQNLFYETSLHLQHQRKGCNSLNGEMGSTGACPN